jgi:hypothetical protein
VDADDGGGGMLLLSADPGQRGTRDRTVRPSRVPVGDDAVRDVDPGVGPESDGPRGAEVGIVRVRGDDEHAGDPRLDAVGDERGRARALLDKSPC